VNRLGMGSSGIDEGAHMAAAPRELQQHNTTN